MRALRWEIVLDHPYGSNGNEMSLKAENLSQPPSEEDRTKLDLRVEDRDLKRQVTSRSREKTKNWILPGGPTRNPALPTPGF